MTVAMIGGGQLARMSAPAAAALGINLRVLVESEMASAAQVLVDTPVGAANDPRAVGKVVTPDGEPSAAGLTFEHEHIPGDILRKLQSKGLPVQPGPEPIGQALARLLLLTA